MKFDIKNGVWIATLAAGAVAANATANASVVAENPTVRIGTTLGDIDVTFYDGATPLSVDNFFAYIDSGRLIDSFFHRSVPGFVVQGGGFVWPEGGGIDSVATFDPVLNEPGISNTRGTIAYAKLGGDPNSATSGFFFNLVDNNDPDNPLSLDNQNGGFTVFARVVGDGLDVVDAIAALPLANAGPPFDTLPINGEIVDNTIQRDNLVFVESITALDVLPGDFNNSGSVEQGDLNLVLNNWGRLASSVDVGLYGFGPGVIDQSALNAVLNNWGSTASPSFEGSSVPEPGLAGLVGVAGGLWLKRRRQAVR
ncbi:MAG: peptidylprolyl isomerase [Planctomycetota bacterium]